MPRAYKHYYVKKDVIRVYVLFRTHLAKLKCFNLRAEDGLEVNVVLKAQPSALRNREAIRVHQH